MPLARESRWHFSFKHIDMIGFINFLIDKGFTPYRKVGSKYIPCSLLDYYSSTVPGYMDIRLRKDIREVVYGLNEVHHPTLIYPRPQGVVWDKDMDRLFQTLTFEEIYNLLWE